MTLLDYRIIGISGTNGSGKDTVSDLLAGLLNYKFISISQFLREELIKSGKEVKRENTRELSYNLENKFGKSYLVDQAIKQYQNIKNSYDGLIISSIRNTDEAKKIKSLGGTMVWVDANPDTRYERIKNNQNRFRPVDDKISFKEFLDQENSEMFVNKINKYLNSAKVKTLCDIVILNNSNLDNLKSLLIEKFLIKSN